MNTRQQTERKAKAGKAVEDVEGALAFAKAYPTKDLQKGTLHEIWKVRIYSLSCFDNTCLYIFEVFNFIDDPCMLMIFSCMSGCGLFKATVGWPCPPRRGVCLSL